jgi:hypothetical protein
VDFEIDGLLKAIGQIGLAVTLALALWYVILIPRKNSKGEKKSSLLVPGWLHDEARAEVDRVRRFYEVALKDEQARANVRVSEWRGFRDEAVAKQVDAEENTKKLLDAVNGLSRDISVLLEIQKMANRDRNRPES